MAFPPRVLGRVHAICILSAVGLVAARVGCGVAEVAERAGRDVVNAVPPKIGTRRRAVLSPAIGIRDAVSAEAHVRVEVSLAAALANAARAIAVGRAFVVRAHGNERRPDHAPAVPPLRAIGVLRAIAAEVTAWRRSRRTRRGAGLRSGSMVRGRFWGARAASGCGRGGARAPVCGVFRGGGGDATAAMKDPRARGEQEKQAKRLVHRAAPEAGRVPRRRSSRPHVFAAFSRRAHGRDVPRCARIGRLRTVHAFHTPKDVVRRAHRR